jgi:hypothetical protein
MALIFINWPISALSLFKSESFEKIYDGIWLESEKNECDNNGDYNSGHQPHGRTSEEFHYASAFHFHLSHPILEKMAVRMRTNVAIMATASTKPTVIFPISEVCPFFIRITVSMAKDISSLTLSEGEALKLL